MVINLFGSREFSVVDSGLYIWLCHSLTPVMSLNPPDLCPHCFSSISFLLPFPSRLKAGTGEGDRRDNVGTLVEESETGGRASDRTLYVQNQLRMPVIRNTLIKLNLGVKRMSPS